MPPAERIHVSSSWKRILIREETMTRKLTILIAMAAILSVAPAAARDAGLYRHPRLDIQFTAPEGFRQQEHPEDVLIYEVANPQTGIHVMLWSTTTEQSGLKYLQKMAHMKDLSLDGEPQKRWIDRRESWVFDVPGTIAGSPIRTLLAVILSGPCQERPAENVLTVVQIWCPTETHAEHARAMEAILESVRITNRIIIQDRFLR
jgi:predicted Zn-dependent protease